MFIRPSLLLIALTLGCGHDGHDAATDNTGKLTSKSVADRLASDSKGKKPCSYMARADAEAALGIPLPQTTEEPVTNNCLYNSKEFYGVDLYVGEWEGITQNLVSIKTKRIAVAGVGDEAMSVGDHLYARKGERGIMLMLNGPAVDASRDVLLEREKALALKILPNL